MEQVVPQIRWPQNIGLEEIYVFGEKDRWKVSHVNNPLLQ